MNNLRIKRLIPLPVRHFANLQIRRWKRLSRWLRILFGGTPARNQIGVYYGHDHIPRPDEPTYGGMVKFQRMQNDFPNSLHRFNIIYMVSSWRPKDWQQLIWLARQKKAKFVWNQNGVAYPAWHGPGWEKMNER